MAIEIAALALATAAGLVHVAQTASNSLYFLLNRKHPEPISWEVAYNEFNNYNRAQAGMSPIWENVN